MPTPRLDPRDCLPEKNEQDHQPDGPDVDLSDVDNGELPEVTTGIPPQAKETLEHVKKTGKAPPGYKGGRTFRNDARGGGEQLPQSDSSGNPISYKEYDVNPYQKGVNRGAERLVVGSDGSSYYTNDHYQTFTSFE